MRGEWSYMTNGSVYYMMNIMTIQQRLLWLLTVWSLRYIWSCMFTMPYCNEFNKVTWHVNMCSSLTRDHFMPRMCQIYYISTYIPFCSSPSTPNFSYVYSYIHEPLDFGRLPLLPSLIWLRIIHLPNHLIPYCVYVFCCGKSSFTRSKFHFQLVWCWESSYRSFLMAYIPYICPLR
jgi:hypothetical protein